MVSFINGSGHQPERKEVVDSDKSGRGVLGRVFVNMPWTQLHRYLALILERRINIEVGFGASDLDNASVSEIAAVIGRIREAGCRVTAHGPFWDLCPGSIDPRIRDVSLSRLVRLFEILEHVRPEQVVCHTGFDPRHHRSHRAAFVENSVSFWKSFIEPAERLGIPVVLENVWEDDPALHIEILDKIASTWFGFCLDTGHQHAFSKTRLENWLSETANHIKEIHLHDNDGSFDYHLPLGQGSIDFDHLFGFLKAKGLGPVLTLEPHREEHLYQNLEALANMDSFAGLL